MPTMAKLFAAVLLGALAYVAADAVGNHFPPEDRQGALRQLSAFFGVVIGWRFLGKRVNRGWYGSLGVGLSAGVVLVIVCLVAFSAIEMLRRAMRMSYGGNPIEALEDMFQIGMEMVWDKLAYTDVIVILVVGSMVCGLVTEAVARRWS